MKLATLTVILCAATLGAGIALASAQQPQAPVDPQIAIYRQMLDNANATIVQTIASAQAQIAQLQKELAAEKAKNAPKDEAKPGPVKP